MMLVANVLVIVYKIYIFSTTETEESWWSWLGPGDEPPKTVVEAIIWPYLYDSWFLYSQLMLGGVIDMIS
jgi:hypothetical protein